jgi:hypothetical protein
MTEADIASTARRTMDWEGFFRRFREPDFIPGYQIENKLGGGVFGEVYRARKLSIGKAYAVKFLKLADEGARDDLFRELQSVEHFAQVDHPHLVSIEDKGEVLGIPYIVMNFAGDETLKVRLSQGALDTSEARALFRQILEGVAALHERSIIHFDLKPANIFLKGPVARVGDYGLSKLVTESARTLSMGRGTPAYMAPEMLRRKGDARSDVYSLGVIFFEMLTGDTPFRGDSEWEVLKKHETAPVVYPDAVPPKIRAFLDAALKKDPEERFADAGVMLSAFDAAFVGGRPAAGADSGAAAPPPETRADEARGVGRAAGEAIGKGAVAAEAAFERVRTGVREILEHIRVETNGAVASARDAYAEAKSNGERRAPTPPPLPRRRGPLFRFLTFPFRLVGSLFRNVASVLLTLLVLAACIGLTEVVLQAALG